MPDDGPRDAANFPGRARNRHASAGVTEILWVAMRGDSLDVLVTGGSGFIGSHVVDRCSPPAIARGSSTCARRRGTPRRTSTSASAISATSTRLCDGDGATATPSSTSPPSADVNEVLADPVDAERRNARGTLNVLEAARRDRRAAASSTRRRSGSTRTRPPSCHEESLPLHAAGAPLHRDEAGRRAVLPLLRRALRASSTRSCASASRTARARGRPAVVPAFVGARAGRRAADDRRRRRAVAPLRLRRGPRRRRRARARAGRREPHLQPRRQRGHERSREIAETVRDARRRRRDRPRARPDRRLRRRAGQRRARRARSSAGRATTPFAEGVRRYVEWHRAAAAARRARAAAARLRGALARCCGGRRSRWRRCAIAVMLIGARQRSSPIDSRHGRLRHVRRRARAAAAARARRRASRGTADGAARRAHGVLDVAAGACLRSRSPCSPWPRRARPSRPRRIRERLLAVLVAARRRMRAPPGSGGAPASARRRG